MELETPDPHDDGAGYVDAATVALRFASLELGPAPESPVAPAAHPVVSGAELRAAMGCLVTGVCVITSVWDGEDVGMTANSVTSVSLDPPLVLVCLAHTARFHRALTGSDAWGVSVLDERAVEVSTQFARPGRDPRRQLEGVDHYRGAVTGVALLGGSCATLECITEVVYPGGDHSIVVGRVVSATPGEQAQHPLLFHRGRYSWLRTPEA